MSSGTGWRRGWKAGVLGLALSACGGPETGPAPTDESASPSSSGDVTALGDAPRFDMGALPRPGLTNPFANATDDDGDGSLSAPTPDELSGRSLTDLLGRLRSDVPGAPTPLLPGPEFPFREVDFLGLGNLIDIGYLNHARITGVAFPTGQLALRAMALHEPLPVTEGSRLEAVGGVYLHGSTDSLARGLYLVTLDATSRETTVDGVLFDTGGGVAARLVFHRTELSLNAERETYLNKTGSMFYLEPSRLAVDVTVSPSGVCYVLQGPSVFDRYCSEEGSVLDARLRNPDGHAAAVTLLQEARDALVTATGFGSLGALDLTRISSRIEAPTAVELCNGAITCLPDLLRAPLLPPAQPDPDAPPAVELVRVLRDFHFDDTYVPAGIYVVRNTLHEESFVHATLSGFSLQGVRLQDLPIPSIPASFVPASGPTSFPGDAALRCTFWNTHCQPQ